MATNLRTVATNRLLLGVRCERSHPFGQTDGGKPRSPRLPFALVVFFTLVSSFGVARLLATLIDTPRLSPLPGEVVGVSDAPARPRRPLTTPPVFDTEAYHRTIIDNNLFRPLGWTPPRPVEPYRLIGTILPRDANRSAEAVIESTAGKAISIVSVGETLDTETKVVSIESKSVVLESGGVRRTLRLSPVF